MVVRMLLVDKKYENMLMSVVSGVAQMGGGDLYSAIKDRLNAQGVPVEDRQMRVSDVPPDMACWHE